MTDILARYYTCQNCRKFVQHHERAMIFTTDSSSLICNECAKTFALPATLDLYGQFREEHRKICKNRNCTLKVCRNKSRAN